MSAEDDLIDAVYLGDDWMLYASTDISYEWSEAVAPCLILGCDTGELCLSWGDEKVNSKGQAFLHAAGVYSAIPDRVAAVILYFDPLSQTGASMQRLAGESVDVVTAASAGVAYQESLHSFCDGSLDGASARTTVARIAAAVLPKGKDRRRIDPRFSALRDWFFEEFEGRIDVDLLGESVGVSGDHLRQIFRSQVGMTLSSYASWVRLYQTACAATHSAGENKKVNASRLLSEVGFYDASHASKVMRRYLDLKPTEMLEPKKFVDCRARNSTSASSWDWMHPAVR